MKTRFIVLIMATFIVTTLGVEARALDFDFAKIVDTNTPMPGSGVTFQSFGLAALDQYQVAFAGSNTSTVYTAIYVTSGGALSKVVDTATIKPGTANYFDTFGDPSISGGNVAFYGYGDGEPGVYATVGGLHRVADSYTAIPSGTGSFTTFGIRPSLDGTAVAFMGFGTGAQQGVYSTFGGMHTVADTNTPMPNSPGNFQFFNYEDTVSLDAGNVAFKAAGGSQSGVYADIYGTLQVVADTTMPMPGGPGNFGGFGHPSLSNGNVAFRADSGGFQGVYTNIGGLHAVADTGTPVPGGTGNFWSFDFLSLDDGVVVFNSAGQGVFTDYGGTLNPVVTASMQIDGRLVLNASAGPEALSNGNVTFQVSFSDGSQAIYVAEQSYDYAANTSGAWDTASNWSFGLKPRAVVPTLIRPEYGAVITGPAAPTTLRWLRLDTLYGGITELRLEPAGQITVNEFTVVDARGRLNMGGGVLTSVWGLHNHGEIDLAGGQINGGGMTNFGTLGGSGTVGNYLYNIGRIQAIDSQVEFLNEVMNDAGGRIDARDALLEFRGGLRTSGRVNFSFGTSDVFGYVQNEPGEVGPGGQVIVSGNSNVTFYDDVSHTGAEFRVSTGSTAVFFGQVSASSPFTGGGTKMFEGGLVPAGSGAVAMDGQVVLGELNTLSMGLAGTLIGQFDQLDVAGQLTLGGTLEVSLIEGFAPPLGATFDLLDWISRSGEFGAIELPSLVGDLAWDTSRIYTDGVLSVASAPGLPGDFNLDGAVDAADYVAWRKNPSGAFTPGDYEPWRANFGRTAGSGMNVGRSSQGLTNAAVPEPMSLWLALTALVGWVARPRQPICVAIRMGSPAAGEPILRTTYLNFGTSDFPWPTEVCDESEFEFWSGDRSGLWRSPNGD